ncbi:MAG: sigma-54-dependent transcriptional regulator, partial [Candidatus Sumerlaeia bacterium]
MNPETRIFKVAVVDDDANLRALARKSLEAVDYEVIEAEDGEEAVEMVREDPPDAMILDVRMPKMDGLAAFEKIHKIAPEIIVIFLTANIDVRDAVGAMKQGAADYLEKPIDLDELVVAIDENLGVKRNEDLPSPEDVELPDNVIARSKEMKMLFHEAARVAKADVSVLVQGESGSGKEILARFVHEKSNRATGPFVAVNCAAFPQNLIESELFGHEKGAFTGATQRRTGRFEEADGGTLFLDEIGEMPLELQSKLLRVLETHTIRRIGSSREMPVNIRLLSASNRNLEQDARAGRFREDLLFRLNVILLKIPALRERKDDILPLANHFLSEQQSKGSGGNKKFTPAAQRALQNHDWPGNVRELRNAVLRASIISRGTQIMPEDLPEAVSASESDDDETTPQRDILVGNMEEIEKQAILAALEKTEGNKSHAAKLLKIS